MARVTFIEHKGQSHTFDAPAGASVMQVAVQNQTPGIDAECGGACSCATCHVYVDEAWRAKVPPPSPLESAMLDFVEELQAGSRLGCQIKLDESLDGLVVRLPRRQA